jgi:hypothetical protein
MKFFDVNCTCSTAVNSPNAETDFVIMIHKGVLKYLEDHVFVEYILMIMLILKVSRNKSASLI